jgi:hypothetical protein
MGYLGVHQLAQKDNWNYMREKKSQEDLFKRYHRLSERKDAVKFCKLYADYVYEGLGEFTALESYLGFNAPSLKAEDDALYLKTKLNLLKALIEKIKLARNPNDPQMKNAFAAIWFYCTCLLKDGTTGENRKDANHGEMSPLIHFGVFKSNFAIDPEMPPDVRQFVTEHFKKQFFTSYQGAIEEEKKKEMHEKFKQKQIKEHFGAFSFTEVKIVTNATESSFFKTKWFWLTVIGLLLAVGLKIWWPSESGDKKDKPATEVNPPRS